MPMMLRTICIAIWGLGALGVVGSPAWGDLKPVVQVIGRISVSVDAIGTNAPSGVVEMDKPVAATLRRAFLSCASNFFREIRDADVSLDGVAVSWESTVFNNISGGEKFFHNTFSDVTRLIRSKVDSAPAGRIQFTVAELDTHTIDGCILAGVFDDPARSQNRSVTFFFGGQATTGDAFEVALAKPIDKSDPALVLNLGLGISFGAQDQTGNGGSHLCGTDSAMSSTLEVNGQRVTSCA